jgi:hypothetical protein
MNLLYPNRFSRPDPTDEPDYNEQIPEAEGWRFEFRDGSAITIRDDDEPLLEGKRKSTAREVFDHLTENELDGTEAINYITKNYQS